MVCLIIVRQKACLDIHCETFDEARDLADRNGELYLWVYIYNDAGEILYETGRHREQGQGFNG